MHSGIRALFHYFYPVLTHAVQNYLWSIFPTDTARSCGITVQFASSSLQGPLKSQQPFLVLLMRDKSTFNEIFFPQNLDPSDYYLFEQQMENKKSVRNSCLSSYEDMKHYYGLKWFQDPLDSQFSSGIAGKELNRERLGRITCSENVGFFLIRECFFLSNNRTPMETGSLNGFVNQSETVSES